MQLINPNKMSDADKLKEKVLLDVCRESQGEYRLSHHGPGSWATTYSNEFIQAAADLFLLYKKNGLRPITCMVMGFQRAGVQSCRGGRMTGTKVEYLFNAHLRHIVSPKV